MQKYFYIVVNKKTGQAANGSSIHWRKGNAEKFMSFLNVPTGRGIEETIKYKIIKVWIK